MPISLSTIRKPDAAEMKGVKAEVKPIPANFVPSGVVHLDLRLAVMQSPHAARMRKSKYVGKAVKRSHQAQMVYRAKLTSLVRVLKSNTQNVLIPAIKDDYAPHNNWTQDATDKKKPSKAVVEAQRRNRALAQNIDKIADQIATQFIAVNLKSVDSRDKVRAARDANLALIKSIPAQYHDALDELITRGYENGERFEGLESSIKHLGDVTDSRAHLIARDQTSKLTSAFNMARQTSLGIEEYQWQGVDDDRERESHVENNNQIFRWDSPPEETGHPGDDVNCRCDALPVFNFEDLSGESEDE
jgi:SPP1 gp7 family putative phage head morphogenesis protein